MRVVALSLFVAVIMAVGYILASNPLQPTFGNPWNSQEKLLARAQELAPTNPIVLWAEGVRLEKTGDLTAAEAKYLEAKSWPDAAANLARLWNQSDRAHLTIPMLTPLVERSGVMNKACWTNLILAYKRLGQYEEAFRHIEAAVIVGVPLDIELIQYIEFSYVNTLTTQGIGGKVGGTG